MIKTNLKYNDAMQILNFAKADFSVFIYNGISVEIPEDYVVPMPVQIVLLSSFVVLIYFPNGTIFLKVDVTALWESYLSIWRAACLGSLPMMLAIFHWCPNFYLCMKAP